MDRKNLITAVVAFLVGGAAGGTAVYFYAKRYFKEQADAEITEVADYYQHKYGELKEETDEKDIPEQEEKESKMQANIEEISSIYKTDEKAEVVDHTAYTEFFNSGSSGNNSRKKGGRKKKVNPVIVSSDIWDNPPEGYETKFLEYFDVDSVMIDEESGQIIEDGEKLVGKDNLAQADQYDNIIIVQNDSEKVIYHVTVEQMSYEEVGGLDD